METTEEEVTISKEQATSEFTKWLDHKKVSQTRRETQKNATKVCVEAIMDGALIVEKDFKLKQVLKWEIGEEKKITSVTYKTRISTKELNNTLRKSGAQTSDEQLLAAASAASNLTYGTLELLDTEDSAITKAIGYFFM